MSALKRHLEEIDDMTPDHVYTIYVKATPERVWQALVDGNDTVRYYYQTRVASDWTPGSTLTYSYPDGSVAADGEVIALDPPRRLEMSFHARWDPGIEAEGPVVQVWEIEPAAGGVTKLSVITSGMKERTAKEFIGGLPFILSGLKSLLETGQPLAA